MRDSLYRGLKILAITLMVGAVVYLLAHSLLSPELANALTIGAAFGAQSILQNQTGPSSGFGWRTNLLTGAAVMAFVTLLGWLMLRSQVR